MAHGRDHVRHRHHHGVQHGDDGGTLTMLGDIEPWPKEHHPDMMAYSLAWRTSISMRAALWRALLLLLRTFKDPKKK